ETPETAETAVDETPHEKGKADNSLTKWIVGAVVLGMLAGYFIIPDSIVAYCGDVINFGLYLILFLVGIDMGRQGTILGDIKAA
ncbi:MAG: LysO family transporter, partial [Oscillospiraceae bacterium]